MSDAASHVTPQSAVTGVTTTPPAPQVGSPAGPAVPVERRLRLWPGLVIVALEWIAITVPPWLAPGTMAHFVGVFLAPTVAALALVLWWLFLSGVRWTDRLLIALVAVGGGVAAHFLAHPSFALNRMGMVLIGVPLATLVWVGWLLVTPLLSWPIRRAGLVVALLLVWGYCVALRIDGATGMFAMERSWRWSLTEEDTFLAERRARGDEDRVVDARGAEKIDVQTSDWPGFRGSDRDGRRPGVRIATDWDRQQPQPLWRQRVGPGWSSFAVVGDHLYTQEQRGEYEAVVCYNASTGAQRWAHQDEARFKEAVSGAGPRATPTVHDGKVYALGGRGQLNCLDAATGKPVWSRDIAQDAGAKEPPTWGFSSSPLVVQGLVLVFAGTEGKAVLAYDAAKGGAPRWAAGRAGHSYCSPHLTRLAGVEQVLIATDKGMTALAPATGKVLWQHDWPSDRDLPRCIQPAPIDDTDVLLGTGFSGGTKRLRVKRDGKALTAEEVWKTNAIGPYYNDLVVHKGYLYGFDFSSLLTCVSLEDGARQWRARGYGNGQLVLLPDQDLLVVLSEKGEVALVEATPGRHTRLAKFQAIEGKTWNHPVVAHNKLFVRNGKEMACYQLTKAPAEATAE
jgi:outer membrane protein assembly factor BamB